MAADYAAFVRALAEHFTIHTIERRGRGESGPQGDDYSIVKECEDVLALRAETDASFLVGHSYGGLVALEVAHNNTAFTKIAVYEPGVSIDRSMPTGWMPGYEKKLAEKKDLTVTQTQTIPTTNCILFQIRAQMRNYNSQERLHLSYLVGIRKQYFVYLLKNNAA